MSDIRWRPVATLLVALFISTCPVMVPSPAAAFQNRDHGPRWTYDRQSDALISNTFMPVDAKKTHDGSTELRKHALGDQGQTRTKTLRLNHEIGNIIRKGDGLLAPDLFTGEILVIDPDPLEVTARIRLNDLQCLWLACSQVDNNYVYGLGYTGHQPHREYYLTQINMATEREVSRVLVADEKNNFPSQHFWPHGMTIMPDGRRMILNPGAQFAFQETPFSASYLGRVENLRSTKWVNTELHDRFLRYQHASLFDPGLDYERRILANPANLAFAVAVHPTNDLYALLDDAFERNQTLRICRFSDNEPLHTEPVEFRRGNVGIFNNMVIAWRDDRQLVIAYDDQIRTFDFSAITRSQPRRLSLRPANDLQCELGETVSQPIGLRLPVDGDTGLSISAGPDGAVLEDGVFRWAPADQDIGLKTFEITAELNGQTDRMRFNVDAWRPFTDIDKSIYDWKVAPDHTFLVGIDGYGKTWFLYDLATGELVQKSELGTQRAKRISASALTDRHLFIFYRDRQADRFDLHDNLRRTSFETPGPVNTAKLTRDGQLQVLYRRDRQRNIKLLDCMMRDVIDVQSLESRPQDRLVMLETMFVGNRPGQFENWGEHYLRLGARIYDLRTNQVVLNQGACWLPSLSLDKDIMDFWLRVWNPPAAHDGLSVRTELDKGGRNQPGVLNFLAPGGDEVVWSLPLFDPHQRPPASAQPISRIIKVGGNLHCRVSNRIYRLPVDPDQLSGVARPMRIGLPRDGTRQLIHQTDETVRIPLSVSDGVGNIDFEYTGTSDHVAIDGNEAVVDAPAILRDFLEACADFDVSEKSWGSVEHDLTDRSVALFDNPDRFREVTGIELPADRYQFQFPIPIVARDSAGQIANLNRVVILLAPKSAFKELLARESKR